MKVILSPRGTARREIDVSQLQVADLWHVAMRVRDTGDEQGSAMILEVWHLAHSLVENLRAMEKGIEL